MLKNYIRIAYRNLFNNKVFSFINILGLIVGTTAFLLIIQYVQFERSYENFHTKADNIFRVTLDLYNGPQYVVTDCETHQATGPLLKDKMPEVIDFVRMMHVDGLQTIKIQDKEFLDEGMYYADPSVFNIFTLKTITGNSRKALVDPHQAVVTKSTAAKYFNTTQVIGKQIKISNEEYTITAVIDDLPYNTHLKFNILLSHATIAATRPYYKENEWNGNNEYTYLLMQPGTDLHAFNKKLHDISTSLKEKLDDDKYQAEYIKDIHLYSTKSFEPEAPGNAKTVYTMLIIGVFIIALAWVNYVNLSTARAIDRSREVGVRKVMGSFRAQLIVQFLCESFIINFIAGICALGMGQVLLPLFKVLTGVPLPSPTSITNFWLLFVALIIAGSLLSGFYPAFVLSSFKPVAVLKGKFKSSSHGQALRRVLVTFQFSATVILLICLLTVFMQIKHLKNYELGFNTDQTLVIRAPLFASDSINSIRMQTFKNTLNDIPAVQKACGSESVPGMNLHELNTSGVKRFGESKDEGSFSYYHFTIDEDFIPTLNMAVVAGRNFEKGNNDNNIIINEEAVQRLGFASIEEAVGAKTDWGGWNPTIVGVIKNFYQRSPKEPHLPMIFRYWSGANYISVSLDTHDTPGALKAIESKWRKAFSNSVFHYFFMDDNFSNQYESDVRFGNVVAVFATLSIIIACLGLFGLSSFTIIQRTKEIGIRKTLGASVRQITTLLSRDFIKVTLIASLLALPVAYYAADYWLTSYATRIELQAWFFILPIVCIVIISLVTVSFQTIKTALSNPVDSLRHE